MPNPSADTCAQPAAGFHGFLRGIGIDPVAMYAVHAEATEALRPGQRLADEVGAVVATEVIRLEHHGPVARRHCLLGEPVFVHRTFPRVGTAVQVDVAHAVQQVIMGIPGTTILFLQQVHCPTGCRRGGKQSSSGHDGGLDELPPGYFIIPIHIRLFLVMQR